MSRKPSLSLVKQSTFRQALAKFTFRVNFHVPHEQSLKDQEVLSQRQLPRASKTGKHNTVQGKFSSNMGGIHEAPNVATMLCLLQRLAYVRDQKRCNLNII